MMNKADADGKYYIGKDKIGAYRKHLIKVTEILNVVSLNFLALRSFSSVKRTYVPFCVSLLCNLLNVK